MAADPGGRCRGQPLDCEEMHGPRFLLDVVGFRRILHPGDWRRHRHEPRRRDNSEDYFLAGRGLSWWLIGFSLIAANISSEQFIGMSGQAAMLRRPGDRQLRMDGRDHACRCCVFLSCPSSSRAGIYTIPEFLEYRFTTRRPVVHVVLDGADLRVGVVHGGRLFRCADRRSALRRRAAVRRISRQRSRTRPGSSASCRPCTSSPAV